MILSFLLLFLGIFACSTSVLWIKSSYTDPVWLSAFRLFIAGFTLLPLYYRASKNHGFHLSPKTFWQTLIAGTILGIHFIAWIVGARMTPAANSSLIVNMVPIVMPFLLFFLVRELINKWEVLGTILAMTGVLILGLADYQYSKEYALGDAVCFISMILYAIYLSCARFYRDFPSIWSYVVPVYMWGGVVCVLTGALARIGFHLGFFKQAWVETPFQHYSSHELIMILGLGLVPTVIGHSIINRSMKIIRGQIVAILNLSQFIYAGTMAYFILDEIPVAAFYAASALLLCGAITVIYSTPVPQKRNNE